MSYLEVELSLDAVLSDEEYEGFELFCNQLEVDYNEGFKKLIQIYLMTTEINERYLKNEDEISACTSRLEKQLDEMGDRLVCVIKTNEMLEEKIAEIESEMSCFASNQDLYDLEQAVDEISSIVDNLSN